MKEVNNNILNKVKNIIQEQYDGEINLNDSFENNGLNSVSFVKIAVSVEKEFDFEFVDTDFEEGHFETIYDFISYIEDRINKK